VEMTTSNAAIDRLVIRDLIENWPLWRDAGDLTCFATLWADDSWCSATWFQGHGQDFIRVTIEGWNKGVNILHFLGGRQSTWPAREPGRKPR
jgi:hypothetical protein